MTIKHYPVAEQPREKLLEQGAEMLNDAELLAVLFGTGTSGRSVIDIAQGAMEQHQTLRSLVAATQKELLTTPGLGIVRYTLLQAAMELGRRVTEETFMRGDCMHNTKVVAEFLQCKLKHHEHETFAVLFLDNKHRLLSFEKLFFGSISGATVHVRQVVKRCLHHNAAAVICAHNHPSGVTSPSESDIAITQRLIEALAMIDVKVLDHVVVSGTEFSSLAELGYC